MVDGKWDYSKNQEIINEQGIINNVIDTNKIWNELNTNNINNTTHKKNIVLKNPVPCPDNYKNKLSFNRNLQPVLLNHSLIKVEENQNNTVISSSQRIRQKNAIFVYYKPKNF